MLIKRSETAVTPGDEMRPTPGYVPQWDRWTRQIATIALILAGIYAATLIAPVAGILTIAFMLSFVMFAPCRALARRTPLSYAGAVVLLYAMLVVFVLSALLILIPAVLEGAYTVLNSLQRGYSLLIVTLRDYQPQDGLINILGAQLDLNPLIEPIRDSLLGTNVAPGAGINPGAGALAIDLRSVINEVLRVAGTLTSTLTGAVTGVSGVVITVAVALFISFLILLDIPQTQQTLVRWIPRPYYREFSLLVRHIVHVWNGFFRGQIIIAFLIGVLTFIQLTVMNVNNALVLSVLIGIISLIPIVGGFISLIPLGFAPLLQNPSPIDGVSNVVAGLIVVGVNLVISQVIWNVVAPKILGDALSLPVPVIIVGVFIGGAVGGVLGAFLVAPVMSTLRILVVYTLHKIAEQDPFPGEGITFESQGALFDPVDDVPPTVTRSTSPPTVQAT